MDPKKESQREYGKNVRSAVEVEITRVERSGNQSVGWKAGNQPWESQGAALSAL